MNPQTAPTLTSVPPAFLNRFGDSITGVLSGFDRLRLRGTLRHLFQPTVMEAYLNACRILIKDFGAFAQGLTARIKAAAYASAEQSGRPFRYPRAHPRAPKVQKPRERNAVFTRQGDGDHRSLPDESGVPGVVRGCANARRAAPHSLLQALAANKLIRDESKGHSLSCRRRAG
jgi:hypothetical protein